MARARKIQRFLSQPFAVAEVFTGTPGAQQLLILMCGAVSAGSLIPGMLCEWAGVKSLLFCLRPRQLYVS